MEKSTMKYKSGGKVPAPKHQMPVQNKGSYLNSKQSAGKGQGSSMVETGYKKESM